MTSSRSLRPTHRLECAIFRLVPRYMSDFATRLIDWHHSCGRHDLPWQGTRDAYRIWLSEIMLQQTQVETVIPYYQRFLERFPDLPGLAAAPVEEVMPLWSGLGYYARARNLHKCARAVMACHGGRFPGTAAEIAELPGIGRSTAAAIGSSGSVAMLRLSCPPVTAVRRLDHGAASASSSAASRRSTSSTPL